MGGRQGCRLSTSQLAGNWFCSASIASLRGLAQGSRGQGLSAALLTVPRVPSCTPDQMWIHPQVTETRTGPLGCSNYDNLDSVSSVLVQSPENKVQLQGRLGLGGTW